MQPVRSSCSWAPGNFVWRGSCAKLQITADDKVCLVGKLVPHGLRLDIYWTDTKAASLLSSRKPPNKQTNKQKIESHSTKRSIWRRLQKTFILWVRAKRRVDESTNKMKFESPQLKMISVFFLRDSLRDEKGFVFFSFSFLSYPENYCMPNIEQSVV